MKIAIAAPLVVFGFLCVLYVQPERAAADAATRELAAARHELSRERASIAAKAGPSAKPISDVGAGTTARDGVRELSAAVTRLLNSHTIGGVSNLAFQSVDQRILEQGMARPSLTVLFDARYEQIGRLFWNLHALPRTFELSSVEIRRVTAPPEALLRTTISLVVFHGPNVPVDVQPAGLQMADATLPVWTRDPFARRTAPARPTLISSGQSQPVVSSILFSTTRSVARIDGQVVGRGDRVRTGIVVSIEPDAVVIAEPGGRRQRVEMERPVAPLYR